MHRGVGEHITRTSQRLFVQAAILCDMLYCTFFSALQGRQLDRLQGPRRAHAGRLLPVQHSGTFLPSEIRGIITFFASKQVAYLSVVLPVSLQQKPTAMFYFPFHSPTNEYYDVDSISEYFSVCPRTHVCVCVYLTRHSKFCSPSLEHCLFFQYVCMCAFPRTV